MSRVRTESAGDSVCPVCHENSEIFAIGPCDHPICYRCSTRMRVLCNQLDCPICRRDLPQIVYLTTKKKYEEVERRSCIPIRKYKILLEDESVEDAFEALLENGCQVCDTRPLFDSFQALQTHMNRTHTLFACDLCVSHLKIFPYERKFYSRKDLATHRRNGDPDNRSYRGHPLCRFCDVRFMDNDELLRHLRKSHYFCHFCDANSSNNEYFDDYPDLKEHFRTEHFLCEEGQCGSQETRFTNAFASDIDYKAHIAAEHMGNKSKAQAREVRTIGVNFHMPPRRRGRDTAVISPEDFEEVSESNRNPRDRRNRRFNRHDMPPRNENLTPPPEVVPPPAAQPPALDDFPTLGNCPVPSIPTPVQNPEVVEDFPSLSLNKQSRSAAVTSSSLVSAAMHPGKSSASVTNQKRVNNFSSVASVVTNSGTSRPGSAQNRSVDTAHSAPAPTVTKQSWGAPRLASGEDFPSLGGDKNKSRKDGPNYVSLGGAWTQKQKNNPRPLSGRGGKDSLSFNSVPSLASLGQTLCDDGEFPSLGDGVMSSPTTWVKKSAKSVKKNTEKCTPLGNSLDTSLRNKFKDDEFTQLNGRSGNKTEETKSKKKKKKQKEKGQETKASTEDSGISLSSIASELDAVAVISEQRSALKEGSSDLKSDQEQVASNLCVVDTETSESGDWETVVNKKSMGLQYDDFPTLSALPKKDVVKASAEEFSKKNKAVVEKTSKTFQDDFPALSTISGKKTSSTSSEQQSSDGKRTMNRNEWTKTSDTLAEKDFPKLQTQAKQTGPPPGFAKPAPPPGLSARSSSVAVPPPGLNSTPPTSSTSSSSSSVATRARKLESYSYVFPQDEKERNIALVSRVRQILILKDDGFDQFRALSGKFRSGQINAEMYHKTCQDLFGHQKFLEVLPELVALLPDILKQHELAEAHSQSILGMCAPLNLTTCSTCHQYLKVEDYPVHFTTHANLGSAIAAAAALPLKT